MNVSDCCYSLVVYCVFWSSQSVWAGCLDFHQFRRIKVTAAVRSHEFRQVKVTGVAGSRWTVAARRSVTSQTRVKMLGVSQESVRTQELVRR